MRRCRTGLSYSSHSSSAHGRSTSDRYDKNLEDYDVHVASMKSPFKTKVLPFSVDSYGFVYSKNTSYVDFLNSVPGAVVIYRGYVGSMLKSLVLQPDYIRRIVCPAYDSPWNLSDQADMLRLYSMMRQYLRLCDLDICVSTVDSLLHSFRRSLRSVSDPSCITAAARYSAARYAVSRYGGGASLGIACIVDAHLVAAVVGPMRCTLFSCSRFQDELLGSRMQPNPVLSISDELPPVQNFKGRRVVDCGILPYNGSYIPTVSPTPTPTSTSKSTPVSASTVTVTSTAKAKLTSEINDKGVILVSENSDTITNANVDTDILTAAEVVDADVDVDVDVGKTFLEYKIVPDDCVMRYELQRSANSRLRIFAKPRSYYHYTKPAIPAPQEMPLALLRTIVNSGTPLAEGSLGDFYYKLQQSVSEAHMRFEKLRLDPEGDGAKDGYAVFFSPSDERVDSNRLGADIAIL